ncbi:hypothetical protein P691DRAFT_756906 [Macrolepiota fuliginosa MF-IS2]|uniref:Zn(2)-C6 fungal-type domain-containing protein n=1 Tax=Macrolepiota fuliginosa MF-IS2 TaxID=1400762 RepID=A0A9P6C7I1_9AGAR|nr:hypothetical protein P691DRAFT_756906 [Macrolepiota fuliginosa MF-IS2]
MPPVPKSPPSSAATNGPSSAKRPGAPKAKGAVRAKSGCYTCRIRRKKCDEQPNDQGHCSTCVRLRLECLGFGAKRPDWLRENRNVVQLRDKIKNFLASQGMIKGHSGSGARSSDQPPVLRLTLTEAETPPYHSGSSSSPPSRSQTLSNDEYGSGRRHHPTSNTRSAGWAPHMDYNHPNGHYATAHDYHRSTSPQSITDYPPTISSPSHSLPFHSRQHHLQRHTNRHHPYQHYLQRQQQQQIQILSPARASSFGLSYNLSEKELQEMNLVVGASDANALPFDFEDTVVHHQYTDGVFSNGAYTPHGGNYPISVPFPVESGYMSYDIGELLLRYQNDVVGAQYLLGTNHIRHLIAGAVGMGIDRELTHEQQAASLLSQVHFLRFARPSNELVLQTPEVSLRLLDLERALAARKATLNDNDAMAALHLVSVILFDGGHGKWRMYLETAAAYVRSKMTGLARNMNGMEELRRLSEKDAFIVKTAIWFDVLASVTTGERPLLLEVVRMLFGPGRSSLRELDPAAAAHAAAMGGEDFAAYAFPSEYGMPDEEKTSMMSPMGCENKVVWAFAEISALSTWKREQKESGRLSIKDLVQRAGDIEKELEVKYNHPVKILADFKNDPVVYSRYLAAHIFRASAMLYLHSVVSDGYPHVAQTKLAVHEVMRWIRRIPKKPQSEMDRKIHKSVIRSTVFSFYIAGALTDDTKYRRELSEYLLAEAGDVVGNCQSTAQLLEGIWAERRNGDSGAEVRWREKLHHQNEPILLV